MSSLTQHMKKLCTCKALHVNATAVQKADPTRTTALRNRFVAEMRRRFSALVKDMVTAIVVQDCFGLEKARLQAYSTPGTNAFDFPRSDRKVAAFMKWLTSQQEKGLITVGQTQQAGTAISQGWTNVYIEDSYKRGVLRAQAEMTKAGYTFPVGDKPSVEFTMGTPFHADRVGVLYSRVFEELKGITAAMDTQISRVLSQGLVDGDNPRLLARKLRAVVEGGGGDLGITDTLGRYIPAKRRAEMLARTEVIRAHHQGMIQEYENWEVLGVTVQAEWATAGFDVCERCADLQGKIYPLKEIRNMIPVHPNCRCMALPSLVEEKATEKTRDFSKDVYEDQEQALKAMDDYIKTLSKEQRQIIREYTGEGYVGVNDALRMAQGVNPKMEKYILEMDQILAKAPKFKGEVYRGMLAEDRQLFAKLSNMKEGQIFTDKAYLSTTRSYDFLENSEFLDTNISNRIVNIDIRTNKGVLVEKLSDSAQEMEVLLMRNSRFIIDRIELDIDDYAETLYIRLKEVL